MDEVHVASDGTAFYTLSDAKNYARTLKNDKVVTVRRTDDDLPSDAAASETASLRRQRTRKPPLRPTSRRATAQPITTRRSNAEHQNRTDERQYPALARWRGSYFGLAVLRRQTAERFRGNETHTSRFEHRNRRETGHHLRCRRLDDPRAALPVARDFQPQSRRQSVCGHLQGIVGYADVLGDQDDAELRGRQTASDRRVGRTNRTLCRQPYRVAGGAHHPSNRRTNRCPSSTPRRSPTLRQCPPTLRARTRTACRWSLDRTAAVRRRSSTQTRRTRRTNTRLRASARLWASAPLRRFTRVLRGSRSSRRA